MNKDTTKRIKLLFPLCLDFRYKPLKFAWKTEDEKTKWNEKFVCLQGPIWIKRQS